ncbi:hypothetical protein AKJ09_04410 [Labilithrix luteola]|uniref:Type IV fimbrial biogenesis protein PilY1 n=1 Tax=Labilithrix luteola TaxID=1391654 RepID=A0A0K1PWK0_9BACT|nr:hypothetical protein [Labilithrix luteola]AKU97746.1 hypothetical protein AKJ09_04410 [Labilithrix luteola]
MKARLLRIGCVSVALAAGVACATSNEETQETTPPADTVDGSTNLPDEPDAGRDSGDAAANVPDGWVPTCSPEGWCATTLPDPDTSFGSASVLENTVFGITNNTSLGTKIVQWKPESGWAYIDDGTQQSSLWVSRDIYAPSEDDVYFAMADYSPLAGAGSFGSIVFHGRRPVAPAKTWTWTQQRFDCANFDEPWLGGTGPDGVYLTACNTVYRLSAKGEGGGADTWDPIYTDDDPTPYSIHGISGRADDLWFVGWRASLFTSVTMCTYALRKTADGFEKVIDATLGFDDCTAKAGVLNFEKANMGNSTYSEGVAASPGSLLVYGYRQIFEVAKNASDAWTATALNPNLISSSGIVSVWGQSNDDLWIIGGSPSLVLRGEQATTANPKYRISSIAINGAPSLKNLNIVAGTSNSNLWVLGNEIAYHKTTP